MQGFILVLGGMTRMLTDAQWSVFETLIETVRPHAKVPPRHLRRTVGAILWRHDIGAKWRSLPAEHGPWWMAAQCFIRWSRLGMWDRLLALVQERGMQLGMTFLDGTSVRADQSGGPGRKADTAAQRDHREALGRSRGGYGTKACVVADATGRAIAFILAPGQSHELPLAVALLDRLPGVPRWLVAGRGYSSHAFREHVWDLGARHVIPARNGEAPVACPDWIDVQRNQVEGLRGRLKEWRAVATRYEQTACSSMGMLCLAAAMDWLKPWVA